VGRYIAVPAYDTAGTITPEAAVVAVLIGFEAATAFVIPGIPPTEWDYPQFAWSSDGRWVFLRNGGQLLVYRPGDGTAYRVDVDIDSPQYGMAAG
jgi:hypothetical protein